MNDLIRIATEELARFLSFQLSKLSMTWWETHVYDRLSFHQQRMVEERNISTLEQLDLAALLRVFDQNWYELSQAITLPREARNWVKELQVVRNKWAHLSAEVVSASEIFRDADTLGRLLEVIGADHSSISAVEIVKKEAVTNMVTVHEMGEPSESNRNEGTIVSIDTPDPVDNMKSMFNVGDLVALRSDPEIICPVIEVIHGGEECRYRVFQDGKKCTYYESQLQSHAQEKLPPSLSADDLRAYITSLMLLSPSATNLYSLRAGRVKFVPYQYRPVLKLIKADRPRLLIADEVGVGKTIEAGLIIKELRARMDIASVLIICPKALVSERKWFIEMKRFDEHFTALDGQMLRHCLQETHLDGEWPDQYSKAIVPFSLFDSDLLFGKQGKSKRKSEGLLSLDPPPKFDLVIVDEAHHIRNPDTYLHQAVRYFCDNSQAAIFLTATPVQLGCNDLFTLLNVLRPDLIIDHNSFEQIAEPNKHINMAVNYCRSAENGWQENSRSSLDGAAKTQWGRLVLRESQAFQAVYDQLRENSIDDAGRIKIIRNLEDLYTFSSLINRTRRRDIGEFTTRKPETLTIDFTSEQKNLHDDLLSVIARILSFTHGKQNVKFMMTTIRRQAASCIFGLAPMLRNILQGKLDSIELMEAGDSDADPDLNFVADVRTDIEALITSADKLDSDDPKISAFIQVLLDKKKMDNNKVLVFTTFRHTLEYISGRLSGVGIRYGVVHGGISDEDRSILRRRFSLPKDNRDAIDVLLSSEVGCEGLDFQFCDLLVNYDLPWNPMRVEQRIGRIDRYGQKSETVAIVNLITPGTVDAEIYERCLLRIGVFQHAVGGSEEILGEITKEIHDIAESFSLSDQERSRRLKQLSDNSIRQVQEEQALEEKQAELFGLALPKQTWLQEIEDAESDWLSPIALYRCVSRYLSALIGSEGEYLLGDKPLKTLRLGQEARSKLLSDYKKLPRTNDSVYRNWEKWLKGTVPMLSVTFDQEVAIEETETSHLNIFHPLVRQAARYLGKSDDVHVSLSLVRNDIPPGDYPFAIYRWKKVGVKNDDVLMSVSTILEIEKIILDAIEMTTDNPIGDQISESNVDMLDQRHYSEWSSARSNHMASSKELVEQKLHSLSISHQARCNILNDQIRNSTNEKIRRMKESELARAIRDYESRVEELKKAENSADIHAGLVVSGMLSVTFGGEQ